MQPGGRRVFVETANYDTGDVKADVQTALKAAAIRTCMDTPGANASACMTAFNNPNTRMECDLTCTGNMVANTERTGCITPTACTGGQINDPNNLMGPCITPVVCTDGVGRERDESTNTCVCADPAQIFDPTMPDNCVDRAECTGDMQRHAGTNTCRCILPDGVPDTDTADVNDCKRCISDNGEEANTQQSACICLPGRERDPNNDDRCTSIAATCTGDLVNDPLFQEDCICPTDGDVEFPADSNTCVTPATCGDGRTHDPADPTNAASCMCELGKVEVPNANPPRCVFEATCNGDLVRDTNAPDMCICPTNGDIQFPAGSNTCVTPATCGDGQTYDPADPENAASCMCATGTIEDPDDSNRCITQTTCTGDLINNPNAQDMCICPNDEVEIPANSEQCEVRAVCDDGSTGERTRYNAQENTCLCPVGQEPISDAPGDANTCGRLLSELPAYISNYSEEDCAAEGGWDFAVETDSATPPNVRESCQIPLTVRDAPAARGASAQLAAASLLPAQVAAGNYDGCVLRQHSGFSGASLPNCNDEELFGAAGLPQKAAAVAAGFDESNTAHRLIVAPASAAANAPREVNFGGVRIAVGPSASGGGGGSSGGGNGDKGEIVMGVGAAALVAAVVYGSWTGNPNAFSFAPQTSFSYNNGFANYSYGSRLEFHENKLSAYWGANQRHSGGKTDAWRYITGVKYTRDFWFASFDSVNYKNTAQLDISFAAQWKSGIWRWHSGINANYRLDESGEDAAAYWNTGALLFYNGWQISPSVDLYWRNGETFGEDARFRIDIKREF